MSIFKDLFGGPSGAVQNASLKEPEWWKQSILPPSVGSGAVVSPDTALQVNAVYACIRILSETIASLPLKVYETTSDGRRLAENHPLNGLFSISPNGEQTAFEMREFMMTNLGLRGNAYAQVVRSGGSVQSIEPLNSRYVKVDRNAAGRLVFDYQQPGSSRVFGVNEIWRIAGLGSDGVLGLSPITQARESVGLAMATEGQAARLFSNGAEIPGVLEFPGTLNEEQIERLRGQFADKHQGYQNAHKPLILESGMSYSTIGMSNSDAQFLESRKFQIAEIARIFRVPLHMLNELDKATFSNIEHQSIEFVMHTIRPWLVRIEQSIARDLLTRQEKQRYFATHSVEGLLRGDTKARYESYSQAINSGWMSPNEVRTLEHRNTEEGLDTFRSPLNMASTEEREAQLNNSVATLLADKEIKAISTEIDRLTPEEFADWVPGFYQRHSKTLSDHLPTDSVQIADYIERRIDDLTNRPVEAVPTLMRDCASEIEALL